MGAWKPAPLLLDMPVSQEQAVAFSPSAHLAMLVIWLMTCFTRSPVGFGGVEGGEAGGGEQQNRWLEDGRKVV